MVLFPSLFPQTFPAAPLLPNGFFHPRSYVCVLRSWGVGSRSPGNFPRILYVRRVQRPHSQIGLTLISLLKTLFATTRILFDSYRCAEITILLRQWRESFPLYVAFTMYVITKDPYGTLIFSYVLRIIYSLTFLESTRILIILMSRYDIWYSLVGFMVCL